MSASRPWRRNLTQPADLRAFAERGAIADAVAPLLLVGRTESSNCRSFRRQSTTALRVARLRSVAKSHAGDLSPSGFQEGRMAFVGLIIVFVGFLVAATSVGLTASVGGRLGLVLVGIVVSFFGIIGVLNPAYRK